MKYPIDHLSHLEVRVILSLNADILAKHRRRGDRDDILGYDKSGDQSIDLTTGRLPKAGAQGQIIKKDIDDV